MALRAVALGPVGLGEGDVMKAAHRRTHVWLVLALGLTAGAGLATALWLKPPPLWLVDNPPGWHLDDGEGR